MMWENMSFKGLYGYIRRSQQKVKLFLHMQHHSTRQMELIIARWAHILHMQHHSTRHNRKF